MGYGEDDVSNGRESSIGKRSTKPPYRLRQHARGRAIDHVEATDSERRFRRLRADAYVLAMGSLSPIYAQPLGIRVPIYPAKGYSVTLPVKDESMAHQVSLTDDEYKLVFARPG